MREVPPRAFLAGIRASECSVTVAQQRWIFTSFPTLSLDYASKHQEESQAELLTPYGFTRYANTEAMP